MKLFINDKLIETQDEAIEKPQTVLDWTNAFIASGRVPAGEIVTNILIDGKDHDSEAIEKDETVYDFSGIGEVKLITKALGEILRESVSEAKKSCRSLSEDSRKIADLFRSQKLADANDAYSMLVGDIQEVLGHLAVLQDYILNIVENIEHLRFEEIWKHFEDIARETITYQEDSDWVMLADLLEYEFAEIFSDFENYFSEVQDRMQ